MQRAAAQKRLGSFEDLVEEEGTPQRRRLSRDAPTPCETPSPSKLFSDRSSDAGKRQQPNRPDGPEGSDEQKREGIPSSMLSPQERQISTCLSLRKKYSLGVQQLTCSLVGFDPANRDGVPLGGHRCDQLLGDIFFMGFDPTEAQHDKVCV